MGQMKKFRELTEASETIVFAYGRFNPPTTGHEKLIQKVVSVAGTNDYRIYPSHSQNPKKDPLPQALKTAYMRKMFRKYARNIVVTKSRNLIEIVVELYDLGYKNITMVAGSDRVKAFTAMINDYNGVEGKKHGYYKFDSIKVISAGERDPDSEGVEGMSASKMRAAASDGNYDDFIKGLPSGFSDSKKLYRDVRKHMGIREERDMGDDYDSLRDAYLTGKIWNVGEIIEAKGVTGEVVRKGTNYLSFMTEDGKVHKAWLHEIELDERNYAKEYANYQGKPEQIARRSSRNKARRVMGDKTKVGMDVGHVDNDPMNNDPKNLRNEDPSKNRAEPRHREEGKLPPHLAKFVDKKGNLKPDAAKRVAKARKKSDHKFTDRTPKGYGPNEELDENWWKDLWAKISQITHPRGWDEIVKRYVDGMKNPENRKHPSMWANDIANEYNVRGVDGRSLVQYINKLVSKGKLPKELKAEFEPMEETMSFKDFVDHINNK